jgi:hypothetical protein
MKNLPPFMQRGLGALIVLSIGTLIFGIGIVVAQDWFDPENAADQMGEPALDEPSGVVSIEAVASVDGVLHVFSTAATFTGAGPDGYGRSAMHAACRAEDPTSHFCTIQEIETAWKNGGLDLILTSQSWIDNAIVGTINSDYSGDTIIASDWYGGNATGDYPYNCNAWTTSLDTGRGLIMNTSAISPAIESCNDIHPIACCR